MFSQVSWKDKDTLLVGTVVEKASTSTSSQPDLTDSGYPRTVREWTRDQPLSEASIVFQGEQSDVSVTG